MFLGLRLFSLLLFAFLCQSAVLRDFQVSQPLTLPQGPDVKQCTVKILERTFAFSYGSPEVVQYTPPTDCGPVGSWAGISLNFTVTSNGTQYDRLGIFTLEHVEIWRTSTPEPTRGDGIIWTYLKDVSRYTPLFAKSGTFMLQLDNLIQEGLDGEYATTLHATFYASSAKHKPAQHADLIIPITTLAANDGNVASVPPAFSLNVTVPRNAVAAYAEIIPSGNGQEEFWVQNVPNQYLGNLPDGTTFGFGPFREVRLLVDGMLAGAVFPYLVVFTGGIAPTLWRPIAAYGALDLPAYYVDLTPFIPLIVDGQAHNITLDVLSAEEDHSTNQNWYVTANLQIVLDSSDKPTTGKMTIHSAAPFASATTSGSVSDGDIDLTVKASRDIHIESEVVSGSGKRTHVVWSQGVTFRNTQTFRQNGSIQTLQQMTKGTFSSTHNGVTTLTDNFTYPLKVNFNYTNPNWTTWVTNIDHSYSRELLPSPFILGTTIQERQQADAFFVLSPSGNYGNGTSQNSFSYVDTAGNTYRRNVSSVNTSITSDHQSGSLANRQAELLPFSSVTNVGFATPRLRGQHRLSSIPEL